MAEYPEEQIIQAQAEEAAEDAIDQQTEVFEETSQAYSPKDDLYSLFWKVVKARDSSKIGNIDKNELGLLNISVRDCQRIALISNELNHKGFSKFFFAHGEITLSTSASKGGFLPALFVTQKKEKTRASGPLPTGEFPLVPGSPPKKKRRFGLFRRKEEQ